MTPTMIFLMIAVGFIATELLIMQFSVFWFLFFGIGALMTSLITWWQPQLGWTAAWGLFLISSLLSSAVLLPPLKRWQNKPSPLAGNDAIGQTATVVQALKGNREGKVSWSGTEWPAILVDGEADIDVGTIVTIRKLSGIRLSVSR